MFILCYEQITTRRYLVATIAAVATIPISIQQSLNVYNMPGMILNPLLVLYHLINKTIQYGR